MKRLIQELYDQVGGTLFFMLEYAKKNDIILPNRDALYQMADRIHKQMDDIEPFDPTATCYTRMKTIKTDEDLTEPAKEMYICIISDITSDIVGLGSLSR